MNITEDARGRLYVIRDDGLIKPVDDACPIWVDLGERHTPGQKVHIKADDHAQVQ